jgi:sporulation protein YlmC with PRC-barrel domain
MAKRPDTKPAPEVIGAEMLEGERVVDARGEDLGTIEDLMIDVERGAIAVAVVSCTFPGGDRLVAVPWGALSRDPERQCFVLDAERGQLAEDSRFTYR